VEAYILERTAVRWTTNITRLRSDDPQGLSNFGFCVGIYGDYAIAGAPNEDIDFDGGMQDCGEIHAGAYEIEETITHDSMVDVSATEAHGCRKADRSCSRRGHNLYIYKHTAFPAYTYITLTQECH